MTFPADVYIKDHVHSRSLFRLGFHYHCPAISPEPGKIWMPGYLGRFLDSLAERCKGITCYLHIAEIDELQQMDYPIQSDNIYWVNLGVKGSVPRRLIYANQITRLIRERQREFDILLIRGPTPLLSAVARAAGGQPTALLLVGDYVPGIDDLPQPGWRKELIRLWARWNKRQQTQVARHSLTFVNSHKLYEEMRPQVPDLVETRTTTLTPSDFYEREDTCQKPPYHLLFTGRLERGKGLADMVTAIRLLVDSECDVMLDIVGWPQPGDPILEEVMDQAKELGLDGRVIYHGFKPLGQELFAYYKQADIYLIASRSSEGFPRTIWEAMAHSLPVVATRVGSIPAFIEGAAVLVEPGTPQELAGAIRCVINDSGERREFIQRGLKLARQNTLDVQACQLVSEMEHWLENNRR